MSSASLLTPKQLLRKHILARSKQVCKEHPIEFRQQQSLYLCEKLYRLIIPASTDGSRSAKSSSAENPSPIPNNTRSIGLYLPLYFEIDVEPLIRKLLQPAPTGTTNTKIFVPEIVVGENNVRVMRFVQIMSNQDLDDNFKPVPPFNIKEPPPREHDPFLGERIRMDVTSAAATDSSAELLDVLIVPGVAFDAKCNRLGKGGGFYDRWITAASKNVKKTLLVGVGFDEQLPIIMRSSNNENTTADADTRSWWSDLKDIDGESPLQLDSVPMESWDRALDRIVTPKRIFC